jgi:hypothetical protein
MAASLQQMVDSQIAKVLERGQRYGRFDQIRQRHFWSSYLWAGYAGGSIPAGPYDIWKIPQGQQGQGYPIPLSTRETNWLGAGRIPDNQNFVITEIGVTLKRPPATRQGTAPVPPETALVVAPEGGQPFDPAAPRNGIAANLTANQALAVNGMAPILPADAQAILYGTILEFGFLTNSVPLGFLADFSQSAGNYTFASSYFDSTNSPPDHNIALTNRQNAGDPSNGIPAAAFRRKLEVPILLQHGESQFMRLNVPKAIPIRTLSEGSSGWFEVRVDWWASESFAEKS